MRFKKRGGRKEIVLPEGHGRAPVYSPEQRKLLLTLARAHRWKELLESGTYPTVKALAAALGLDRSYVAKLLNLTLLAPTSSMQPSPATSPPGCPSPGCGRA